MYSVVFFYVYIYIYIYIYIYQRLFCINSQRKCDRAKWLSES